MTIVKFRELVQHMQEQNQELYDNFHIQWHIVAKQGSMECE
jgi:hypothetical protein